MSNAVTDGDRIPSYCVSHWYRTKGHDVDYRHLLSSQRQTGIIAGLTKRTMCGGFFFFFFRFFFYFDGHPSQAQASGKGEAKNMSCSILAAIVSYHLYINALGGWTTTARACEDMQLSLKDYVR